jgi:hypothetical protein
MKNLTCLAIIAISLFPKASWAQTGGGRGGEVVECQPVQGASHVGTYFLDYLVREELPEYPLVREGIASLEESVRRIQMLLEEKKMPRRMINSHRDFFQAYFPPHVFRGVRFESSNEPMRTNDQYLSKKEQEKLARLRNCHANGRQALVRFPIDRELTVIKYDADVFQALAMRWEQLSWALHHEWLREFSESSAVVRGVNYVLHSQALEKMPKSALCDQLRETHICASEGSQAALDPTPSLQVVVAPVAATIIQQAAPSRQVSDVSCACGRTTPYTNSFTLYRYVVYNDGTSEPARRLSEHLGSWTCDWAASSNPQCKMPASGGH